MPAASLPVSSVVPAYNDAGMAVSITSNTRKNSVTPRNLPNTMSDMETGADSSRLRV